MTYVIVKRLLGLAYGILTAIVRMLMPFETLQCSLCLSATRSRSCWLQRAYSYLFARRLKCG